LNTRPKYVASTAKFDPKWPNTTVLSGDLEATIREMKAKVGGELQVHGSGALFRWLLDNNLVDEMNLFIFPVLRAAGGPVDLNRYPSRGGLRFAAVAPTPSAG
jgi:dihydrofolate reductase